MPEGQAHLAGSDEGVKCTNFPDYGVLSTPREIFALA